jgi:predicted metal-dependent phosphoesterase TrpH
MDEFHADLHCHTTCSDGTFKPQEIIQLAHDVGLQGLSITDHDTISAYQEAVPAAQAKNLPLISGLELSAIHQQTSVHILAYSFSLSSPIIKEFCQRHHQRREQRNQAILTRLAERGMPLSFEDFPQEGFSCSKHSIGRPHIAMAMVKKGYVNSIQEAFHEYIGEGKPCYEPGAIFSVEETLEIIHQAKGLAIIAHPHLIEKVGVLGDLLEMKFDGIEGYYARFPRTANERWLKIGARKGWIITGGSDFHGDIKPTLPLGSSWVNAETFAILEQHFQRNQQSFIT